MFNRELLSEKLFELYGYYVESTVDQSLPTVTKPAIYNMELTWVLNEFLVCGLRNDVEFQFEGNHSGSIMSDVHCIRNKIPYYIDLLSQPRGVNLVSVFSDSFRIVDVGNEVIIFDLDRFLDGNQTVSYRSEDRCHKCGERIRYTICVQDGKIVVASSNANGVERCYDNTDYTFELKFKAGDVVHFGDFLGGMKVPSELGYSLNLAKGEEQYSRWYAEHNIGRVQVGNSCPSVYIDKDSGDILVGLNDSKYTDEEYDVLPEYQDKFERIGYVCTDLWAVSIGTERDIKALCEYAKENNYEDSGVQLHRSHANITLENDSTFVVHVHRDGHSTGHYITIEVK